MTDDPIDTYLEKAGWRLSFFCDCFYHPLYQCLRVFIGLLWERIKEPCFFLIPCNITRTKFTTRDSPCKLENLIHNFENNHFEKQFCFDDGKMIFFTAFFWNNTNNIYSPQWTVRLTIMIAAAVLASASNLFACILCIVSSSSSLSSSLLAYLLFLLLTMVVLLFAFNRNTLTMGKSPL